MDELLEQVMQFAKTAHGEQRRMYENEPYTTHLARVMARCGEYTDDIGVLSAAILHDVLEDTSETKAGMQSFLQEVFDAATAARIVTIVDELTDKFVKRDYPQWNRRVRKMKEADRLGSCSSDAQTIKYADIIDNSLTITGADEGFVHKYLHEARHLLHKMKNGNPALREVAIVTVEKCILNASLRKE